MPKTQYLDVISEDVKLAHGIFASNIKEARQARQWTQQTAAQRCSLPLLTYRAVENGNLTTGIGAYWQVLDTFGLLAGISDLAAPQSRYSRTLNAKLNVCEDLIMATRLAQVRVYVLLKSPHGEDCLAGELFSQGTSGTFRYSQSYLDYPWSYPLDPANLPLSPSIHCNQ